MAYIHIYGGFGEIGGNKIFISSRDGAIFLDFGLNLKKKREYSLGYGVERTSRILKNYLLINLLPNIRGIYRSDLSEEIEIKHSEKVDVDACIISHAHLDHYGLVGFLESNVKIAVSKSMKALIEHSIETSGRTGVEGEVFNYRDKKLEEESRKHKSKRHAKHVERPIVIFEERRKIPNIPVRIEPHPVDHSIPASFGFIIEVDGVSIAYTGDIRLHGVVHHYTESFIEKARDVEYLIVEGTRIEDSGSFSEEDVKQSMMKEIQKKSGKFVAVLTSSLDIDRVRTTIEVAEECGRTVILSPRIFHLISTLKSVESRVKIPEITYAKVYFEKRSIIDGGYFLDSSHYRSWLKKLYKQLADKDMLVKSEEVKRCQEKYLMIFTGPQYLYEFIDIEPSPGSLLIISTSEPHDEEQEIEWEKAENWINLLRLDSRWIHSSGHANREDLLEIIKKINPKNLVPVHTENPREYVKLAEKENLKCRILLTERINLE
ncbi:MAG: MBL fold metallo-hydrolase [Nitrososphaerota archaeon]